MKRFRTAEEAKDRHSTRHEVSPIEERRYWWQKELCGWFFPCEGLTIAWRILESISDCSLDMNRSIQFSKSDKLYPQPVTCDARNKTHTKSIVAY